MATTTDDRPLVDQLRELLHVWTDELAEMHEARKAARAAVDPATLDDEARVAHNAAQDQAEAEFRTAFSAKEKEIDDLSERIKQETAVETAQGRRRKERSRRLERARAPHLPQGQRPRGQLLCRPVRHVARLHPASRGVSRADARARLDRHGNEMRDVLCEACRRQ